MSVEERKDAVTNQAPPPAPGTPAETGVAVAPGPESHGQKHAPDEESVLVSGFRSAMDGLKAGPSRSTTLALLAVAAVVLVVVLFRWFWSSSEQAASSKWLKVGDVAFREDLDALLESAKSGDLSGTTQGMVAKFREARRLLDSGIGDLGREPATASNSLGESQKLYEDLSKVSRRYPLLHQESLWGAGNAAESLGEVDQALGHFNALVREYPASVLGKQAAKKVERLGSDQGRRDVLELKQALKINAGG